ncbi:MAG: DNA-directed RNA polymerase subunit N [Candidatus Heimdallarchaeota archaeon]|nr:DNA-directed RNA polymerase subunit N [Candidatus Heimdallarchaeota archaeon]
MLIPVRCFSCGTVVGDKYEDYKARTAAGESSKEILDELGLYKYCCRRMLISQVDLIDIILPYNR